MAKKADYSDLSLFEQFSDQTHKALEENSEFEREPIFYPHYKSLANYKVRLYPIIKEDPDTGKPKLVLTRQVWSHSGFEKTRRLACTGRDCAICSHTKKLKEANYSDAWKYTARGEALVLAYVYESSTPKDYKYMKTGEYGYLVLRNKAINSLNAFLANLTPEEMKSVLNPTIKANRVVLTISPGSDGSVSWGFDIKQAELPPLPDDFPDIDSVYVNPDKLTTDEELKTVRTTVNKLLATMAGILVEPDEDEEEPAPKVSNSQAAKSAVGKALGKKPKGESSTSQEEPSCPGIDEGLSWGNHPQTLGEEPNITCLSCPHESSCEARTKSDHDVG